MQPQPRFVTDPQETPPALRTPIKLIIRTYLFAIPIIGVRTRDAVFHRCRTGRPRLYPVREILTAWFTSLVVALNVMAS